MSLDMASGMMHLFEIVKVTMSISVYDSKEYSPTQYGTVIPVNTYQDALVLFNTQQVNAIVSPYNTHPRGSTSGVFATYRYLVFITDYIPNNTDPLALISGQNVTASPEERNYLATMMASTKTSFSDIKLLTHDMYVAAGSCVGGYLTSVTANSPLLNSINSVFYVTGVPDMGSTNTTFDASSFARTLNIEPITTTLIPVSVYSR
jgi:hypothetical protein